MADSEKPQIAADEATQDMLRKAKEDFPNVEENEAVQLEANMGPGKVAQKGEGQPASGVVETIKEKAAGAVEAVKQANPATRDYTAPRD